MITDSRGYCYHKDGLGSIVNITDRDCNHIGLYVYRSFGNLHKKLGINSPFLFSSKPLDTETNLYYYINRYYDPDTGRFITQDPLKLIDRPNPYTYPNNDPINYIDPYGLCGERREKRTDIPWWEKLEKGYYYGTGFGEKALEYYVQRWIETDNPLWTIPSAISSLWTPETYQDTAWTLISAYIANEILVKHVSTWAHWEHKRGPHKFPHLQFGKKYIKVEKWVLDLLRKKIKF